MTWAIAAAGLSGYAIGSISFARIITRLVGGTDVKPIELVTPDGRGRIHADVVSATAVRLQLGPRWGLTVAALDIAKAALPTLAWRLAHPEDVVFLVCAAAVVVGHNWPVWHRFRGGNGQSPIIGGLLVIDWLGVVVTNGASYGISFGLLKDGLLADVGGILLVIPWLWWRFGGDPAYVGYAVAVNVVFWVSFWPNLRQYLALKRGGHLPTPEDAVVMYRMDYRFMRRLSPEKYAEVDRRAKGTGGPANDEG